MTKLSTKQIDAALKGLPQWSTTGEAIQRTMQFADFVSAMAFVNRIAQEAEGVQHHPDILIRYNKVTLTLSTHDAGGLTKKDFDFARRSDELVAGG
ncbi:MAG TPA: 4a-hydroxytetrahydrobiopterin dehydratase [Phycisphaerales bacterium]|nr:4a-hydroxytetrahydrobiopterin dehydratase [Phycisphaerales bacterium]